MNIDKENINKSINKGVQYLIGNQKNDGSICLDDTRWQVWETANSLISLQKAGYNKKHVAKKAIEFILNNQRQDGSFYHQISFEKDQYCTETTSACAVALFNAKKEVQKSVNFLLSEQKSNGSWEIGTPEITKYRDWPSITGFAVSTLLTLGITSKNIEKGVDFLLNTQLNDGSWGRKWIYYDTPFYCLYVILLSLKLHGISDSNNYLKATKFIRNTQKEGGFWDNVTTDKPRPSQSLRTALALISLLASPKTVDLKYIENGIEWLLLQQQDDGSWNGGFFVNWPGKKENIYTSSKAIYALQEYINFKTHD